MFPSILKTYSLHRPCCGVSRSNLLPHCKFILLRAPMQSSVALLEESMREKWVIVASVFRMMGGTFVLPQ